MQGVRGSSPRSSTNRDETADPSPLAGAAGGDRLRGHRDRRPPRPAPGSSATTRPRIEPRWQARWAELGLYETDLYDDRAAQVLPADDVPVSVGRHPHRPLVHRHADRRDRPLPADARLERVLPDRLRCLRAPGRERRDQERHQPARLDDVEHRQHAPPVADDGRDVRLGGRGRHRRPDYYRWNQWLFLRFLKAGLAYRQTSPVDWCPNDGTLAREQVEGVDRHCWRCGAKVEKRDLAQWYLPRSPYADELLDFTGIQWPEPIKIQQTNWIGRSEGGEIDFDTAPDDHQPGGDRLRVFTTRPGHAVRGDVHGPRPRAPARAEADPSGPPGRGRGVRRRRRAAGPRSSACRPIARRPASRSGADAINPVNGERIPIFIADYVLGGYGTGAIMAVPAHDERDYAFAVTYGLPIRRVVAPPASRTPTRRWTRRTSRTPAVRSSSTAGGSTACPPTRAARRSSRWLAEAGRGRARSPTACATG